MNCIAAVVVALLGTATLSISATLDGGAEFVADERPLCTPCTGTSTGCSSTQYCVNVNNMVTPGCCREKQAAGGFCVPRRAGVDCTSGRCNNVIPAVSIFGIPIGIQNLNQWVGNCA